MAIREVGYDNERGKGDHGIFKVSKRPTRPAPWNKLMADFWSDVWAMRGEK
jgi:hypothetical protein